MPSPHKRVDWGVKLHVHPLETQTGSLHCECRPFIEMKYQRYRRKQWPQNLKCSFEPSPLSFSCWSWISWPKWLTFCLFIIQVLSCSIHNMDTVPAEAAAKTWDWRGRNIKHISWEEMGLQTHHSELLLGSRGCFLCILLIFSLSGYGCWRKLGKSPIVLTVH